MLDPRDLTDADFESALLSLLPQGLAWPKDEGSALRSFWGGIAAEVARIEKKFASLLDESVPPASAAMLSDWERVFGLPDPCTPSDASVDERRNAIRAKLRAVGGASRAYFAGIAESLGYQIEITEYRPFRLGLSRCGAGRLGAPDVSFFWTVSLAQRRLLFFRVGAGGGQVGLNTFATFSTAAELECIFQRLKPAHTTIIFDYSQAP